MGKAEIINFLVLTSLILLVFIGAVIGFVIKLRRRKLLYDKEKQLVSLQHAEQLSAMQLEIQQQTMQHIGRELHDDLGQQLTLASIYAQQLQHESACPGSDGRLEQVNSLINSSLGGIRNLSRLLTDPAVEQEELVELLRRECDKVNGLGGCKAHLESIGTDTLTVGPHTKLVLLRLVQESIQNSLKHARCSHIYIRLEMAVTGLKLGVQDDGRGFDTGQPGYAGSGLRNMKKRAAILDADFSITSSIDGGTLVMLVVPPGKLTL